MHEYMLLGLLKIGMILHHDQPIRVSFNPGRSVFVMYKHRSNVGVSFFRQHSLRAIGIYLGPGRDHYFQVPYSD